MATIKEIKHRRNSIESTRQITKAMKLVATVKLQKTKEEAENAIPYFETMYETMVNILEKTNNIKHKYLSNDKNGKTAIIVISSDRGLAGGYNSNIVREFEKSVLENNLKKEDILIYSIGAKVRDALSRKGYKIEEDLSSMLNAPGFDEAYSVSNVLLKAFTEGKISSIYILYTFFKNTVVHIPRFLKLLPIVDEYREKAEERAFSSNKKSKYEVKKSQFENSNVVMNYEPNDEEILDLLVPKYITAIVYGAITSAIASENGARMTAMDNATNNADELIEELGIQYNRARQGAITQELTEIIAGANAI